MRLSQLRGAIALVFTTLFLAGAQTRQVPPAQSPGQRPSPAARSTPLGRIAPEPLHNLKMFLPGNFPPAQLLDSTSNGVIPDSMSAVEREQMFNIGPNAPIASLTATHIVEPNKAALRIVAPMFVGDSTIIAGPITASQRQTFVCLDLDAGAGKTYFMDVIFSGDPSGSHWDVYGPDSKAEMDFPSAKGYQHLTYGFTNPGKAGKFSFQMAPRQESNVYRVDVYAK